MVEAAGGLAAERPRISPESGVESKFSRHGGAVVPAAPVLRWRVLRTILCVYVCDFKKSGEGCAARVV